MTFFQAIILGIVQGLSEFLPISSSAHLVLVPFLLNWKIPSEQIFPFDVLVQLGTLAAVIVYLRKDLTTIIKGLFSAILHKDWQDEQFRLVCQLIIASLPAAFIGFLLKGFVERAFHSPLMTGVFLLITAFLLFIAERFSKRSRTVTQLNTWDALWIGIAQTLSIFPGISRSGATIGGGMLRHLRREDAARFSFLMSIPIMLGAGLLSLFDLSAIPNLGQFLPVLLAGFLVAGVVGYMAIHWLMKFLRTRSLYVFVIYCTIVGVATVVIHYV